MHILFCTKYLKLFFTAIGEEKISSQILSERKRFYLIRCTKCISKTSREYKIINIPYSTYQVAIQPGYKVLFQRMQFPSYVSRCRMLVQRNPELQLIRNIFSRSKSSFTLTITTTKYSRAMTQKRYLNCRHCQQSKGFLC